LTAITQTRLQGRLQRWLPPLAAAVLLCTALWVLHTTLQGIHYRELQEAFAAMSADHLAWAMLFCLANYLVLTTYDQLAFVYIGKRIARAYIALTAFIGYAISNSVGFALLSGTAVRHHFYSRRGVASADYGTMAAAPIRHPPIRQSGIRHAAVVAAAPGRSSMAALCCISTRKAWAKLAFIDKTVTHPR
jgi:uncharacterized membrane protein YbhN (UPF0104 family)